MKLNYKLYLLHNYYSLLSSLLVDKEFFYFSLRVEEVLEDFHIEEYLNGEWDKKLLSDETFNKLRDVY